MWQMDTCYHGNLTSLEMNKVMKKNITPDEVKLHVHYKKNWIIVYIVKDLTVDRSSHLHMWMLEIEHEGIHLASDFSVFSAHLFISY